MFSQALYRIHHHTKSDEKEQARTDYIHQLEEMLEMEVRDAHNAFASEKPNSKSLAKTKHRYRRYVAGHHQILYLMKQGDKALSAAMVADVMIMEGHRYVVQIP